MRELAILIVFIAVSGSAIGAEPGPSGVSRAKGNKVLDPVLTERYEYHEVFGGSEKDLRCDLTLKAIKCNDGRKYDSTTDWKVKWNYGYSKDAETCTTESFTVTVDIVFRLPKWARGGNVPEQLADKWDCYTKNLLAHETGHKDRALAAAAELTRMIADLPPSRSCSELDREVNRISRDRLQRLLREQAEYDESTGHGRSQGVVFP